MPMEARAMAICRFFFKEKGILSFLILSLVMLVIISIFEFQRCVAMCMDRYMDSWNLVSRTFSNRLQKEAGRLS